MNHHSPSKFRFFGSYLQILYYCIIEKMARNFFQLDLTNLL